VVRGGVPGKTVPIKKKKKGTGKLTLRKKTGKNRRNPKAGAIKMRGWKKYKKRK